MGQAQSEVARAPGSLHPSGGVQTLPTRLAGKDFGGRRRAWRSLRWLVIPLGGFWAAWMIAVHVFLWTPLLRKILRDQDVWLDYRSAWSVWPGTVHLRGVALAVQDAKIELRLTIDELVTSVVVTQLPRRIFHCSHVFAKGITFRMKSRVFRYQATPERMANLPPIEGLEPIRTEQPEDDTPDTRYKTFSIWLEGIDGPDVREVWINQLRLDGHAHVGGAFYLKPGRQVFVAPGLLWAEGLTLHRGPDELFSDLRGPLLLRLGPVDPRQMTPLYLARFVDLDTALTGKLSGARFLSTEALQLSGGEGPFNLALHLQAGQVVPGSVVSFEARRLVANAGPLEAQVASARFRFEVPGGPPPHFARATLVLQGAQTGSPARPAAATAELRLEATGDSLDVAAPEPPRELVLDLRSGQLHDARPFGALFGPGVLIERGHGAFAAHLAGPFDRLAGWVRASASDALLVAQERRIRGDVSFDASVRALDPLRGADLAGTKLVVASAQLVHSNGVADAAPGWWGRFELSRAQLRFSGQHDHPLFDADLVARCRDARPLVGLFARQAELPRFVAGLFAMEGLDVRASAEAGKQLFALRGLSAQGEGAAVQAVYQLHGDQKRGAAYLTVGALSVSLGIDQGGTSVHLLSPGSWFAQEQSRLQPRRSLGSLPRARPPQKPHAPPVQSAE